MISPPQYGELRPTSGWYRSGSLGHPCKFQRVSRLGSIRPTARHSSIGRQPNFAALNRGRHLYSAGRPSCWALANILVIFYFIVIFVVPIWSCLFPLMFRQYFYVKGGLQDKPLLTAFKSSLCLHFSAKSFWAYLFLVFFSLFCFSFWASVCKTVHPTLSDRCLSCPPPSLK